MPQPPSTALLNRPPLTPPPLQQHWDESHEPGLQSPVACVVLIHSHDGYRVSLAAYLRAHGFSIIEIDSSQAAMEYVLGGGHIDVVLIDADLPGMPGMDLLVRLRSLGVKAPIALVATTYNEAQEETALEYGAADFLSKTRSLSIIAKRLRLLANGAQAKSALEQPSAETIAVGQLTLKLRCHRALWKGHQVSLTVTEFKIVRQLACRAGEEVSYREIYDVVHGAGFLAGDGPHGYRSNVRSLIRKIRNRFRTTDADFAEIENYPAFGYRWRAPGCDDVDTNPTGRDHPTSYLDRRNTAAG
jgi:two-component system response regulator ChvI